MTAHYEPEKEEENHTGRKIPKKAFMGVGIAAIAVLLIIFAGKFLVGGNNQDYCMYIKDGELVYDNFKKDGAYELTSRLLDDTIDPISINDESMYSYYVKFSKNEKYVFYPDRLDDDEEGVTIYRRNLSKPNEEPIKIDSGITNYQINSEGTKIIYLRGVGEGLYSHDMKDKEKIASEVDSFYVADDCKKISYLKSDNGGYYIQSEGKEAEKLVSDIEEVQHVSSDLSTIYYKKEGGLYKQTEGDDDVTKIASDVCSVQKIYDSGEIYYTKEKVEEVALMDYVTDDMADADAIMTEPEYPDSPWYWDYETDKAYEAARDRYDKAVEEYEEEYDRYSEKCDRDVLRENLQEQTMENYIYTLYYYDGEESEVISESTPDYVKAVAENNPVIAYEEYNQEDLKMKLSEISTAADVEEYVYEAMYSSTDKYIAVGEKTSEVEQEKAEQMLLSEEGNTLYYLDDVSEKGRGSLYKASIENDSVQKAELLDDDVNNEWITLLNNKMVYFKNYDSDKCRGDLWVDGKEVDYDVSSINIHMPNDTMYYLADWNNSKEYGTLKMYKNGESTKIADDVYSWKENSDKVLYLSDYSWNSYCGTLYMYKNGEAEKISDDVSCIIK